MPRKRPSFANAPDRDAILAFVAEELAQGRHAGVREVARTFGIKPGERLWLKRLLHEDGLTIKGVLRLHKDQGTRRLAHYGDPDGTVSFEPEGSDPVPAAPPAAAGLSSIRLRQVLAELEGARARLEVVLSRSA
jgi:hypothetical protein